MSDRERSLERVRALIAKALSGPVTEESRTCALTALQIMKRNGFEVVDPEEATEYPDPSPFPDGMPSWAATDLQMLHEIREALRQQQDMLRQRGRSARTRSRGVPPPAEVLDLDGMLQTPSYPYNCLWCTRPCRVDEQSYYYASRGGYVHTHCHSAFRIANNFQR